MGKPMFDKQGRTDKELVEIVENALLNAAHGRFDFGMEQIAAAFGGEVAEVIDRQLLLHRRDCPMWRPRT